MTKEKKFTNAQIQVYRDLRNGHYVVYHWEDGQSWLMKGRGKVRVISPRVRIEDLFGLVDEISLGTTVITTAREAFDSACFLRGNIAQANCKEAAERSLALLEKINKELGR